MDIKFTETSKNKLIDKLLRIRREAKNANSRRRYDRTVKKVIRVQKEYDYLLSKSEGNIIDNIDSN